MTNEEYMEINARACVYCRYKLWGEPWDKTYEECLEIIKECKGPYIEVIQLKKYRHEPCKEEIKSLLAEEKQFNKEEIERISYI